MNLKTILLIALVIIALAGAYVWFFVYNKKHRDIEKAKADFKLPVTELVKEFEAAHDSAHAKYNGKVIEITGVVDSIIQNDSISSIVFRPSEKYEVICQVYSKYNEDALKLKKSDNITLKGEYISAGEPEDMLGEYIAGDIRLKKSSFEKK